MFRPGKSSYVSKVVQTKAKNTSAIDADVIGVDCSFAADQTEI